MRVSRKSVCALSFLAGLAGGSALGRNAKPQMTFQDAQDAQDFMFRRDGTLHTTAAPHAPLEYGVTTWPRTRELYNLKP
jgi:hypothetical protein